MINVKSFLRRSKLSTTELSKDCSGTRGRYGSGILKTRTSSVSAMGLLCLMLLVSCSPQQEAPVPKPMEQPLPSAPVPIPVEENKVKNNVLLEKTEMGGTPESQVGAKIQNLAKGIDKEAVEAKVDEKWSVSGKTSPGKKVDVEATKQAVMNAKEGETVKLVVKDIKPRTVEQVKANIVEIGSYTTNILDKDPDRVKNIELASQKMDMKKTGAGEIFSFNAVVGRRTEAKGYEEAPIIIQTEEGPKKDEDVGGGVCQVSSTLYNAAQKAGLEIVERHAHSKKVGYVPQGHDATVSYGTVDFKFKNNRKHPVMTRTYLNKNNTLTIKIFENRN